MKSDNNLSGQKFPKSNLRRRLTQKKKRGESRKTAQKGIYDSAKAISTYLVTPLRIVFHNEPHTHQFATKKKMGGDHALRTFTETTGAEKKKRALLAGCILLIMYHARSCA